MPVNRRKFLFGATSFTAALIYGRSLLLKPYIDDYPHISSNKIKLPPNGKTILIVGAGLSGLMTACDLIDRGFNVTILEKGHFPGGKLFSWEDPTFLPGQTKPFILEHATHGVWSSYNNLRDFLTRHELTLREKTVNEPYSPFSVVHPEGQIMDFSGGPKWPSLFYAYNETGKYDLRNEPFTIKQVLSLISFDAKDQGDVEYLDSLTMKEWCDEKNIPASVVNNFVTPLLNMSNFADAEHSSALAWHRHTSNSFGHWKDLAKIQFFLESPMKSLIRPMEEYITKNGGKILYGHSVCDVEIEKDAVTSLHVKMKGNTYICPACGHQHDGETHQCSKCGFIGEHFLSQEIDLNFSADHYLLGMDIKGLQKLIQESDLKEHKDFEKIHHIEPTKVVVCYMSYPKSEAWEKKLGQREVFFSARFPTIGTVLNINKQKPTIMEGSAFDVFEVEIPGSEEIWNLNEMDLVKLIDIDLRVVMPELPTYHSHRTLKWDNYTGERVGYNKNSLEMMTPFKNLLLLGDHIKIKQNAQYMEKVAVVSKEAINYLVSQENIQNATLEILESETPDILLDVIRRMSSPKA